MIIAKMMIIFIAIIIIISCSFYRYEIMPVDRHAENISFVVETGDTWYSIGSKLYDANLIRSSKFYKIYIKLFLPGNLEAGEYTLSKSMGLNEIVDTLEGGNPTNPNVIKITFQEGINVRGIANLIDSNTDNTYDDFINALSDTEFIDSLISEYWFLTDDIKNEKIYYSLEGYLFPATYEVDKTKDVKVIIKSMLDKTNTELNKYKDDINNNNYSIHQILTLASIVELEVGNAIDRSLIAGVFYNRLKNNWTLGSDVTTYYSLKTDDFSHSLTNIELSTCNSYNTRSTCLSGLPVGPVGNPSEESIAAVLNPTVTNDFYFVNGCDGVTLTAKTEYQHNLNIAKLKREGNWSCFTN
ncbi:MAG: endolytic transglycosylase MltG [Bacilli bacterium]|nr:endolytic transglycosylase MltG [Bacilli bacterium]